MSRDGLVSDNGAVGAGAHVVCAAWGGVTPASGHPTGSGCPREPCDDLLDDGVRSLLDLGRSLILDRV